MFGKVRQVVAAAACTAVGVTLSAAPAAAQFPGANGVTSFVQQVNLRAPCFRAYFEDLPAPFNHGSAYGMAYSADGQRLAVSVQDLASGLPPAIWVVHVPTCTARKLSSDGVVNGLAWSPDGRELAVGVGFPGAEVGGGIQILDASTGAVLRTVTRTGARPSWSPNGAKIAYQDGGAVWTAPARSRVTPNGRTPGARKIIDDAADPDFSPDGTRLAFIRDQRIGHAEATHGRDLTLLPAALLAHEVVWSPDGRYFLYQGKGPEEFHFEDECSITTVDGVYQQSPGKDPPCYTVAWQPLPSQDA